MTRKEQIKKQADIYIDDASNYIEWSDDGGWSDSNDVEFVEKACIEGAKWADIHPKSPWISVEDDLPCNHKELMVTEEYSCNVFIACKDGYVSSDFIIKGFNKWYWNGDYDPDYWMFPPKLPKE